MAVGVLCVALMHAAAGSDRSWIVLGLLSLAVAAAVWTTFGADGAGPSPARADPGRGGMRWDFESVRLVFCFGATGFGYIIPATFLPAMARQVIHDPAIFGWSWPVFGAAAMATTELAYFSANSVRSSPSK